MASYQDAVKWIAAEDSAGDTPASLPIGVAFAGVDGLVSVVMVADLWHRDPKQVAVDVLKARGFKVPKTFLQHLQSASA